MNDQPNRGRVSGTPFYGEITRQRSAAPPTFFDDQPRFGRWLSGILAAMPATIVLIAHLVGIKQRLNAAERAIEGLWDGVLSGEERSRRSFFALSHGT